jgi:hypothetical protein
MASRALAAAKFFPAHLDSSPRIAPQRAIPTANLSFSPLPAPSSSSPSLLRLRSPSPSGPGGRLPPPPPPRSYGGAGSGDAADSSGSGGDGDGSRGGILGVFLAGWAARVAADPQFPFKVLMEEVVGVTACVLGDMASRPNFGLNELDLVFSTVVVGSIVNFVIMYLLAPTAAASSVASSLPNYMFEPGAYTLGSRVATVLYKGAIFTAVGFAAGLTGTALSNGLIAMRKRMDPAFETPNKAPPTLLNAATWGLHMGGSSNLRYQTLNGIEYILGKVAPAPVFKASVVALRCMNNVLGGMSFVMLARLTGAQKSDKPATDAEEKETLIAVGNAAADAISEAKEGMGK